MSKIVYLNFKRVIIIFILSLVCCSIYGQDFTIKGTFKGKEKGFVLLRYFKEEINKHIIDTAYISYGKFEFSGKINRTEFASFTISDSQIFYFFIQPGTISIELHINNPIHPVITGSKIQDEYEAFLKYIKNEKLEIKRINDSYHYLDSHFKVGAISKVNYTKERSKIDFQYSNVIKDQTSKEMAYIRKHPDSYINFAFLLSYVGRFPEKTIDSIYAKLSYKIKGSSIDYKFIDYVVRIRKALSKEYAFDKLKLGDEAPSFTINKGSVNNQFSNDDFRDKLLLIEFWGIYCIPCLKENLVLEELRIKFGKDKMAIIAVNNNNNKEIPILATYIKKNKLSEWIHVFTNDDIENNDGLVLKGNFDLYEALSVPRTILVDKKGKIRYKYNGYSENEIRKLEDLIKQLLKEDSNRP
jgi:thiol-disulfide isomerase/thioredoxin